MRLKPKVSVIIATCKQENLNFLIEAVKSINNQTYSDVEAIIVVDNNLKLYELLLKKLPNQFCDLNLKVLLNKGHKGLSASRNTGILHSSGDIVCFIDDDAVADKCWIEEIVKTYEQYPETCGVGGSILPLGKIPWWLPEDFYWLLGATPRSLYQERIIEVRNTPGSNISFKREVFKHVGLFNNDLGLKGATLIQAEETEFCIRCIKKLKRKILYNPKAIVYHHVLPEKTKLTYLLKRAFNQGTSKALLKLQYNDWDVLTVEQKYLTKVLKNTLKSIAESLKEPKKLVHAPLSMILTTSVGLGFIYGLLKPWSRTSQ